MMSTTNQQSVSLADGTLSRNARVNYEFGLVLGVNEFRQEQDYFLHKDYLYNRAFQGYGTVSGLHVTAEPLPGKEVQITVSPGMAIDQFGRPIVVGSEECARLAAWLAKQEQQKQGTIDAHRDDDTGELHVYIVASYDDYPDQLVPIAGQACNTGDTSPVPSRIRDSYEIDFSWEPPAMPAWDSVRYFAKLLAQVRIKSGGERNDVEELIEQIRKLDQLGANGLNASPSSEDDKDNDETGADGEKEDDGKEHDHEDKDEKDDDDDGKEVIERLWYIPADEAREALDRIFTVWVTEARPKLTPNVLDPTIDGANADARILLARIDFTLDDDFPDSDPKIEDFDPPDSGGRPFLLHAQTVQELLLLGRRETMGYEGNGRVQQAREFATLQVRNSSTLCAWVHHPEALILGEDGGDWGEALEVRCDGRPLKIARVEQVDDTSLNVFEITVKAEEEEGSTGVLMGPRGRVELIFKVDEIDVERDDDDDDDEGDDHDDGDKDESPGEELEEGLDKVEDTLERGVKKVGEELEESAERLGDVVEEGAGLLEEGAGEIVEDIGKGVRKVGEVLEHELGVGEGIERAGAKIAKAGERVEKKGEKRGGDAVLDEQRLDKEEDEDKEEEDDEDKEEEDEEKLSLGKSIARLGIGYVGFDHEEKTITVYTIANRIPVHDLVTFFTFDEQTDVTNKSVPATALKGATVAERFLALWFHTDDPVKLPAQVRVRRTFINLQTQDLLFKTTPPPGTTFSSFWALEPQEGTAALEPGELLTVIFDTNEMFIGGDDASETLTEAMKEEHLSCVGYDGNHTIELYHQVSFPAQVGSEQPITAKLAVQERERRRERETREMMTPAQPFVTITVTRLTTFNGKIEVNAELWFHIAPNPSDETVSFTEDLTFEVLHEGGSPSRRMKIGKIASTRATQVQHNVFTTMLTLPQPSQGQVAYYLRWRFPLEGNPVNVRGGDPHASLGDYIRSTGIRFEGHGTDAIVANMRIPAPLP
jgi:hypothetical protein